MTFNWSDHLESALTRISELATGATSLRVYRAGGRVALAVPEDQQVAEMVMNLYQPQRLKGRLFKQMVRLQSRNRFNLAGYKHLGESSQIPEIEWLIEPARSGTLGFLGCNPAHGLRCIVAGISPSTGESFIVKLGCDESAEAVKREHTVLIKLQDRYPGVIKPAGSASGKDWFAMKLPYLGHTSPGAFNLPTVENLLSSWCSEERQRVTEWGVMDEILKKIRMVPAMSGWQQKVGALKVSRSLVHGDFALWNLRDTPDGLHAIDWEWADENGLAGIDLIHGLRQEALMVKKLGASAAFVWIQEQLRSDKWVAYLSGTGWEQNLNDLLRIGLLHSHFIAKNDSKEMLGMLGIEV